MEKITFTIALTFALNATIQLYAASFVGLGDLVGGSFKSDAFDVSSDGSVVVGYGYSASGLEAFRWASGGGMIGLGDLAGGIFNSSASSTSSDGSIIVGYAHSASGKEAFRWASGGGMIGLGDLAGGGFDSEAIDVSSDGSLVVGNSLSASGYEAFIWDATSGMRSVQDILVNIHGLDLTGWKLTGARGISADGNTIVGFGKNPDGFGEAWVANIGTSAAVPEPSTYALIISGVLGLIYMRRRIRG